MRVNIYAEEMTDRVEIISKEIEGQVFTGLRLYLELPATVDGKQHQGPFMHRPGDDDSAAITFWGKHDLRSVVEIMKRTLDEHYAPRDKKRLDARLSQPEPAAPHSRSQLRRIAAQRGEPAPTFEAAAPAQMLEEPQRIIFEGNDCVVMAPEDYEQLQQRLDAALAAVRGAKRSWWNLKHAKKWDTKHADIIKIAKEKK